MSVITINNEVEAYQEVDAQSAVVATKTNISSSKISDGDSVFSYGLSVLFLFMEVLSEQANAQYANMEAQSAAARKAQEHAATVDGQIADLASGKTTELNPEVRKFIEENKIEIDGICSIDSSGRFVWENEKTTYTYMHDNGQTFTSDTALSTDRTLYFVSSTTTYPQYTTGQLTAIKGALDSTANRSTDFVSTAQLQLQKQMQTYNVCVSLINSMQSMLADMNKTIAQGIR
ncbi:secretion protein EspA [Enterobacter hormaechei]|nr:secretion protein EspA [Enterobacter hormaechei]